MNNETHYKPMSEDILNKMSPENAFHRLVDGNKRFLGEIEGTYESKRSLRDFIDPTDPKSGQFPFALVLSCIDSRMPTETLFDQSVGDIFNARIAGNFVNTDILGSMEFACNRRNTDGKWIGARLILVLGHTSCGAINGAFQAVYPPSSSEEDKKNKEDSLETPTQKNLIQMLGHLTPAIKATPLNRENVPAYLNRAAEKNVALTIDNILMQSKDLRDLYNAGKIWIEGAMYDVKSGKVTFSREDSRETEADNA